MFSCCFKSNYINQLKNSNKSLAEFTFKNKTKYAKVVDVYDGDTIKVAMYLDDNNLLLYKYTCRLLGIDSPEIRNKNLELKKFALLSKEILIKLIENKIVKLECHDFDKYGRVLVQIYIKTVEGELLDINQYMLEYGYCYAYDGGTKKEIIPTLNNKKIPETISII